MAKKILIVDDSVAYRQILSRVVSSLPETEAPVTAPSGSIALKKLAISRYDVVLLDVVMPEMDGIETLERIKKEHPEIDVVMVSGATEKGAQIIMKALDIGALGFIPKPTTDQGINESIKKIRSDLMPLLRISEIKNKNRGSGDVNRTPSGSPAISNQLRPGSVPKTDKQIISPSGFSILAIGISTGGPKALITVLKDLPSDFPLPIVVVQHMPPVFTSAFARDLNNKSKLEVVEAAHGDLVEQGKILLAPGGRHMVIKNSKNGPFVGLNDDPCENSCRPSVDVLFRSIARSYWNKEVLSMIMTGMGNDGLKGMEALKQKSCYCITQSKESCVVYGMPLSVDEAGFSDESVDLDQIASRLIQITGTRSIR